MTTQLEFDVLRMMMTAAVNAVRDERADLESVHGQVWNTQELSRDFTVSGFCAPFVVVERKSDGQVGSLMFQHAPRYYFTFKADTND